MNTHASEAFNVRQLFKRTLELIILHCTEFNYLEFSPPAKTEAFAYSEAAFVSRHRKHWLLANSNGMPNWRSDNPLTDILAIEVHHTTLPNEKARKLIATSTRFKNSVVLGWHDGNVTIHKGGNFVKGPVMKIPSLAENRALKNGTGKKYNPIFAHELAHEILEALS